ncbi:MAG: S41 family peptidase [Bacteroidales bacterium]
MKNIFLHITMCLVAIISMQQLQAQDQPNWLRYPSISPDGEQIAFTYKGNIYVIAADGGVANQLTFHEAHDYMPRWSHDGSKIAFASDRYGNFDIFVMSAEGGSARRLSFHSNNEVPYSFSSDDQHIIFGGVRQDLAEHRQFPTASQPELYQVAVNGGRVAMLFTIPMEYVQSNKTGDLLIYHDKKGGENEWRKKHQSAIARDIWIYNRNTKEHRMLTDFYGEDRNPVFSANEQSIFYLSEASGTFNIHKMSIENPEDKKQLSSFELHPVRFLSASKDDKLAFGYDGELYTMHEGEEPRKIEVIIRTQDIGNPDSYISINGGVREMDISPDGKEIAFIARGEVFVTSVDGKLTKRITQTAAQEKFVTFGPEGKSVVYAREEDGKWGIYQSTKIREDEPFFFASTLLQEELLLVNEHENYLPKFSPDGKKMAYIENRKNLNVYDLASKTNISLLTSEELFHMRDGDQYFEWSPDSKWLLAVYRPTMPNGEVVLLDASGKEKMRNLTLSGYSDSAPKWVNDGKQMIWFSNRDGLKSFATSGTSQSDVYSMFFTREGWDQFNLSKEEFDLQEEVEKANKKEEKDSAKEEEKVNDLKFEWDNIEDRKARLTIHSSSLGDAVLSKGGEKLYYLARFEKGMNLWSTDLRTKETKMEIKLNASYGRLMWDKDMSNLYLLSGGNIAKIDIDKSQRENIKIAGEMSLDKDQEREVNFEHVWIRTKGIFYEPGMHGVDWDLMRKEYGKYLPHIGNGYEFAEMLSEMLGELNVSHAGARYNRSIPNADATASLGIFMDYKHSGEGIKIAEVISSGPLDKAGLDVAAGMIIRKIDGETVSEDKDVACYLNRKADQFTALELYNPEDKSSKTITVKPITLGQENRLLYKRWVRKNQKEVERMSEGRLGYVHIPGMSDGPYRNTYEEMMGKYHDKEGVIVDTRFNGGGDLVADLAMFFTGERFLTYATEERAVGYEPTFRWTKPTLAMFNEGNYSDGHCFACGYTDLKIGKTVGMPVPGTCSFAGWEGLSDGVRWGTVPVSAKNKAGEWLENNETKPDVLVKNMPGKIDQGIDQQLEVAIKELLEML